ncbi:MAG TPA: type 1 glutamine amidotransferase domain-containing protein [Kineosporiaceae bacterium]|nr:type 1 glutamine amidotransferase domain-containing protein [Kineosporiaceae bacterium]
MAKILFVMTAADHWTLADGTKHPTGFWAEEVVVPYRALTAAGHQVVVATPGGVVPTVDATSVSPAANGGQDGADQIQNALAAMTELQDPVKLDEVSVDDYAAVYVPGGHGPMEDLAVDAVTGRLLALALGSGKPLALVCHGLAALLAVGDSEGPGPFDGYRLTGFTNAEETQGGLASSAPWLLQDRLVTIGADFQEGEPWAPHLVVDRNLITGQNPASSAPVAAEILKALP